MFKRIFSAVLAAVLLLNLSACNFSTEGDIKNKLTVYYINGNEYETGGNYLEAVDYSLEDGEDLINNALDLLGTPPAGTGLMSALVKGTRIYSYTLDKNEIEVSLSPAYQLLTDLEKALIKSCLALTLCAINEIDSMSIYVDGKLLEENIDERMIIIEDTDTNEFEKQISLFFPEENYNYLQPEYRVLTVGQDKPAAEYVIEELIKSTQTEGLKASLPEGTRLISADVKNGVCTVNLSREFVDNRPETAAQQRLTVYSIVNSVTRLDNTEKVIFYIEGKSVDEYEYIDISDTFTAFEELVYYQQDADKLFATVYLGHAETGKMIKTPVIIDKNSLMTVEENIVRYVLSLSNVGGYEDIIPHSVMLRGIETVNGICTVDLSSSFFAGGSIQIATLASCAIAASVIDSGAAAGVNITVNDRRYLDYITIYDDIIIE